MTAIADFWGNRVACAYGTNDCLESVAHDNGRQITFSNEWQSAISEWRVAEIDVVGGASLAFNYNGDGQFTQIVEQVDANSYTSSYKYADGFLTNRINGAGFEYSYTYEEVDGSLNGKGTFLEVDGYYGHTVSYDDLSTDVTYKSRGTNQIFRYTRNSQGKQEATYGPVVSIEAIEDRGTRYVYATNEMDTVEETLFNNVTDATWSKWMRYDDTHNVTNFGVSYGSTNPAYQVVMEYDSVSKQPTAVVDAEGLRLEVVFTNGLPLVEKQFYSASNSYDTCYTYTSNGLVQALTNANGRFSAFCYDNAGNLIATKAQLGPISTNCYSSLGFLERAEMLSENGASTGRITLFENDAKGRVLKTVFADGLTNSFSYNALGYLTNSIDRAGRHTDYAYAPTEKLTTVTRWLKQGGSMIPVRIGYDLDEQMNALRISEPRGRYVESYQLDVEDRVTSITNIEGQVMTVDYSVGGFVTETVRLDGTSITNTYDSVGRRESATYRSVGGLQLASISNSYYADGLLATVADGASSVSNSYNILNRLTNQVVQAGSIQSSIDNTFDALGIVTNSVVSIGGTMSSSSFFSNDLAERLTDILTMNGVTTQHFIYAYSPTNGMVESVSNTVSGITCTYFHNIMDQVTNITYRASNGSLILSLAYSFDVAGMITNKSISYGLVTSSSAYSYDTLDRLIGECTATNGISLSDVQYSYDLAGNRLTKTVDSIGVAYTLGTGNRLASAETVGVIDVQGTSTEAIGTDDSWGELWVSNITVQAGWVPEIDGSDFMLENLPVELGTNQIVAAIRDQAGNTDYTTNVVILNATNQIQSFAYDTAGCMTNLNGVSLEWDERYRLKKVNDASSSIEYRYDVLDRRTSRINNGTTNYFVYNGDQVVADLDNSGNLLRTYIWGPSTDNLLGFTDHSTSNTYYAIKDHQNSVVALADESGLVVERYEYTAYGVVKVFSASGDELSASAVGNRYTFQGREIDWDTGLIYFRARWYDSDTGRWLSKDPIGVKGGLNLYVFCRNNPVNLVDPQGLADFSFLDSGDPAFGKTKYGAAGVTTISGHGSPSSVRLGNTTTRLDGTAAGNAAEAHIPDGDLVILYMCNTGLGDFAQDFANATGNTVLAPLGVVTTSGKVYPTVEDARAGTNQIPPRDAWKIFEPETCRE